MAKITFYGFESYEKKLQDLSKDIERIENEAIYLAAKEVADEVKAGIHWLNTGSTVTYSEGALIGKAVELSIELEEGDDNILYADNGPAESANTFSGGSLTLTTDDLLPDVMMKVLGVTEETITSKDIKTETPKWYNWDDDQNTPYLGFGAIVKVQNNNVIGYQAVILPKIKLNNPSDTFTTQGETIEFGTPEISGTILRSDGEKHTWKKVSSVMNSEADAEAAIKQFLSIAGEP